MSDFRRCCFCACCLVVLLRMAIGWQFLYEGLWKVQSQSTASPWTAAGYLKNAQGPLRPFFRALTGDPDDLNWLDPKKVADQWDVWHKKFVAHYKLTDQQKQRLNEMLNGSKAFAATLDQLPDGVEFRGSLGKVVSYNAERKLLLVDGRQHLTPRERDRLLQMVTVQEKPASEEAEKNGLAAAFQKAVRDVYARSSRPANAHQTGVAFKERLLAMLVGDPARAGLIQPEHKGTIDYKRMGDMELYKRQLKRYETDLANAKEDFHFAHLKKQFQDLQGLRVKSVGPIKALDKELKIESRKLLTGDQAALGPVDIPMSQMERMDFLTMWSLTIIGTLLIAGLFTRLSAIAGAGLLAMFYLAIPPWPGVPPAPGPEHSFIVNKNLIEAIALLAIAAMPTGQWFGIDALVRRLLFRKNKIPQE